MTDYSLPLKTPWQNGMIPEFRRHFPSVIDRLLVAVVLIALHTNPFDAQQPVPYLISFIAAGMLFLRNTRRMTARETRFVVLFLLLALVCSIIAPRPQYMFARMRSFAYLGASVIAGFSLYLELRGWPKTTLARWAGVAAMILLVGSLFEVALEPVKKISDAYRYVNFSFPYEADLRDIYYHQGIRPKFFSSEPSYLGKHFAFFLICWLYVSKHRYRILQFIFLSAAGFVIIRSPVIFILTVAAFCYLLFDPSSRLIDRSQISKRVIVVGLGSILTAAFFGWIVWNSIGPRMMLFIGGDDKSSTVRLLASFEVVPKLLVFNPLTGIGVGGTEAFAYDVIADNYEGIRGGLIREKIDQGMLEYLVQNWPANFIISFGLFGSCVGLFLLVRLQRTVAYGKGFLFWPIFFAIGLTEGALNGLRIWTIFFVLLAYLVANETRNPMNSIGLTSCPRRRDGHLTRTDCRKGGRAKTAEEVIH